MYKTVKKLLQNGWGDLRLNKMYPPTRVADGFREEYNDRKHKKGLDAMQSATQQTKYNSRYVANRMARTIGQVKMVRNMVETGADCTDVLIQLAAVRGQLDSICSSLMVQYAEQFAEAYRRTGDPELLEDFKAELAKAVKK